MIKESNGSLHSPNYPSNYPSNKKCIWRIVASNKAKIFFNFTEFDVEGKEVSYLFLFVCMLYYDIKIPMGMRVLERSTVETF